MNPRISFIALLLILVVFCPLVNAQIDQTPKKVIVSGKVLNFEKGKETVDLTINFIGVPRKTLYAQLDAHGAFQISFEAYIPTDVLIQYRTNFLLLVHPGDSLHIEFDGKLSNRMDILASATFSGDASEINREAALFQKMYYSSPLYWDRNAQQKAVKEYDVNQYQCYLDTFRTNCKILYDHFLKDVNPKDETKRWASVLLEETYYDNLAFYPQDHKSANDLQSKDWDVPVSYYNSLTERLPISEFMFISGYAMEGFINRFHYKYVSPNLWNEEANKQYKVDDAVFAPTSVLDSLNIYGIIKYVPDKLLRQLVLTELISEYIERGDVAFFENNRKVFDTYILEPFLKQPLYDLYEQKKKSIENPRFSTKTILNTLQSLSIKNVMDSILSVNKGKVIYIDCWATWCGPCKAEMPNSKVLMKQMAGKEVTFVYICIDSPEKLWKSNLSELQLEGQHYFLSDKQSNDFKKLFNVNGVPFYFLIDKNGLFVESGTHLRPGMVTNKIEGLLKN